MLPPTYATQGASSKQEVIRLDNTTMDAFTSFAISQGLRLKELTMPAAATPYEVLRRFYIVLDLAEKDKGLIFYSFDYRVCGMCSLALPDIPGLSSSDMNVIKMAMAPSNEDYSMVTWVHNDGYMAGAGTAGAPASMSKDLEQAIRSCITEQDFKEVPFTTLLVHYPEAKPGKRKKKGDLLELPTLSVGLKTKNYV